MFVFINLNYSQRFAFLALKSNIEIIYPHNIEKTTIIVWFLLIIGLIILFIRR